MCQELDLKKTEYYKNKFTKQKTCVVYKIVEERKSGYVTPIMFRPIKLHERFVSNRAKIELYEKEILSNAVVFGIHVYLNLRDVKLALKDCRKVFLGKFVAIKCSAKTEEFVSAGVTYLHVEPVNSLVFSYVTPEEPIYIV